MHHVLGEFAHIFYHITCSQIKFSSENRRVLVIAHVLLIGMVYVPSNDELLQSRKTLQEMTVMVSFGDDVQVFVFMQNTIFLNLCHTAGEH